ncbi:STAS-like domain-containing protein [Thiobacillus denitrificans]|uniref:STAS-like domain-containing protein n=1 Tax=Thiobacillus denitrificans TaxID=36861 RepID=UPI00036E59DB|nr:STAS-like domain-containing protein [Thiobacillus denitrificans]
MVQLITIPMTLAQAGDENLVSRAQAKLIAREIEKLGELHTVCLDFANIPVIGQGFADELFRVFAASHSNITFQPVNCNPAILAMIARAKGTVR